MSFLTLLFAHLLADYPLQGDFLAKEKGNNPIALFAHAGIWTGVILVTVFLLGYEVNIIDITWLFIIHAIADYSKANKIWVYGKLNPLGLGLLLDQTIHVLQIAILVIYKGMI